MAQVNVVDTAVHLPTADIIPDQKGNGPRLLNLDTFSQRDERWILILWPWARICASGCSCPPVTLSGNFIRPSVYRKISPHFRNSVCRSDMDVT
ncbi:hypothetical protein JTE90_022294 [Oedothorax gibbosus]|uniref:Uncharacterized protein n=1 Tax=Oedothorax gibbosus TaxID=931172 RepID=A0AAV6VX75_9ARAC|nr:hypothetical protein JTE90_022294 [Oedothorax gibbosus]